MEWDLRKSNWYLNKILLSSRKDITLLYIIFSRTLDSEHNKDTGRWLLIKIRSSFIWSGIILAISRYQEIFLDLVRGCKRISKALQCSYILIVWVQFLFHHVQVMNPLMNSWSILFLQLSLAWQIMNLIDGSLDIALVTPWFCRIF